MSNYNYEIESLIDNVKEEHTYLSETKKEVIDGVKGNYPQLCTYEAEWIYFDETGYMAGEPVELEYQTITNTTQATVENAIPQPYKQASLHGLTLKNKIKSVRTWYSLGLDYDTFPIHANTNYLIQWNFNVAPSRIGFLYYDSNNTAQFNGTVYNVSFSSSGQVILTSGSVADTEIVRFRFDVSAPSEQPTGEVVVIEYHEGMENWDIPYFEGMQSVKMPVLTTVGKNLYTGEQLMWTIDSNNAISTHNKESLFYFRCKPNTTYTFTTLIGERYKRNRVYEYYAEPKVGVVPTLLKNNISTNTTTITTSANAKYIIWQNFNIDNGTYTIEELKQNAQIEEGSTATTYEPYKTNILTVNEEVDLRGIGEVQDELDLLTGELTERIGEIVLNGSEDWLFDSGYRGYIDLPQLIHALDYRGKIICNGDYIITNHNIDLINDNLPALSGYADTNSKYPNENWLYLYIPNLTTIQEIKEHLAQNPITVQYVCRIESIKSVNMNTINKPYDGVNHFTTSSNTIPPTITLQVPIVSTGAQTLQDINE